MSVRIVTLLVISLLPLTGNAQPQHEPTNWRESIMLPIGEDVSALHARANNATASQADRARAVFSLFAYHLSVGATASEVRRAFTNTAWLKETEMMALIHGMGGFIPLSQGPNENSTAYCLVLFPDATDQSWSPWFIYFKLSGHTGDEGGMAFMKGSPIDATTRLLEFTLCFPHYPPTSRHLNGPLETFSNHKITISDPFEPDDHL